MPTLLIHHIQYYYSYTPYENETMSKFFISLNIYSQVEGRILELICTYN